MQVAYTVVDHFRDSGVVGYYKSVEAPLTTQYVCHQPLVGGSRHTVYFVERCHHTSYTGFNSSFVGQHVFIEHPLAAHVYRVVVASAFPCAIQCKVFYAGHDFVIPLHILSLITEYHCFGNHCSEKRVFTAAFGNTSPTWVA